MGGVGHPSQLYAVKLLKPDRVKKARKAIEDMGLGVYIGNGGFYHWLELPEGMESSELNKRLFKRVAAILCASDCNMARPHSKDPNYVTPYARFFRF
jgi:hypothetical protein